MATSKVLETTTLSIEVEVNMDKDGNPIYQKKNFSNIRGNATIENIVAAANAISNVLSKNTGEYYLNEVSKILNN